MSFCNSRRSRGHARATEFQVEDHVCAQIRTSMKSVTGFFKNLVSKNNNNNNKKPDEDEKGFRISKCAGVCAWHAFVQYALCVVCGVCDYSSGFRCS